VTRYAIIATILKIAGERLRDWLIRRAGSSRRTRIIDEESPLPASSQHRG
jgi:hypothetical protein